MKKEMLINVLQPEECRIAILEDGVLEELYVERTSHESYVGNIYKGRIVNIEPSIQAAFVDFGVGRNGFLHVSDVEPTYYRHLEQRRGERRPARATAAIAAGDRDRDRRPADGVRRRGPGRTAPSDSSPTRPRRRCRRRGRPGSAGGRGSRRDHATPRRRRTSHVRRIRPRTLPVEESQRRDAADGQRPSRDGAAGDADREEPTRRRRPRGRARSRARPRPNARRDADDAKPDDAAPPEPPSRGRRPAAPAWIPPSGARRARIRE